VSFTIKVKISASYYILRIVQLVQHSFSRCRCRTITTRAQALQQVSLLKIRHNNYRIYSYTRYYLYCNCTLYARAHHNITIIVRVYIIYNIHV